MRPPFDQSPAPTPQAMDHIKTVADAAAVGGAFGSFIGIFPVALACIASMLSIVWLTIQITDWYFFKRKDREK